MLKHFLVVVVLCVVAGICTAQEIRALVLLKHSTYLLGEPVLAQIDLVNAAQDTLEAGLPDSPDSVTLEVYRMGETREELMAYNKKPVTPPFMLKTGEGNRFDVSIDKWFPLLEEGRYIVRAVLAHARIRHEGPYVSFDIVAGMPLSGALQMFASRPELRRRFQLVYWNRDRLDRLFLRTRDEPLGRVWDTVELGPVLRITPPKISVQANGEVVVVHRASRDRFSRAVFWSLPNSMDLAERESLLDPDISAQRHAKELYSEMDELGKKRPWWQIW